MDYVLFSDSAVKVATNEQQWYVTISRGRRGVKIFTADKIQLRQNIAHSGDRPLALDMARERSVHKLAAIWGRDVAYVLNIQHLQRAAAERQTKAVRREESERQAEALQRREAVKQSQKVKQSESVKPEISRRTKIVRRAYKFAPRQNIQRSRGIGI